MRSVKDNITWCLKQKRGIKVEQPNDNLAKAFIKKAKSALNMLSAATEKDEIDWVATTAYYARYFSLYGLLQKCGIKSEIHDCTVTLLKFIFVDEFVSEELYQELQLAKQLRVDTQYYVADELDTMKLKKDADTARQFVLKMEEVIDNLSPAQIEEIRKKIIL
tara:strand:- start:16047 stop:16535 length:489 start_codon:yes stop_codon:yes gene_type:complete